MKSLIRGQDYIKNANCILGGHKMQYKYNFHLDMTGGCFVCRTQLNFLLMNKGGFMPRSLRLKSGK